MLFSPAIVWFSFLFILQSAFVVYWVRQRFY
jgi:hypothetical protein